MSNPKVEKEVLVNATPEEVWAAISRGEGLKQWFPLDAQVTPGVGGSVMLSWGAGAEWASPIEVWEPTRHLRTVDTMPGKDGELPIRIAVDYLIEARGGQTLVRLIHSGFASDTWQDELDSLDAGWTTFLFNLKVYLELHRGETRTLAHYRHEAVAIPRSEAFRRTLAALGIANPDVLKRGGRFSTTTRGGDHFEGEVAVLAPPINFTGLVTNWSNGVLMVEIEPGKERCRPAIWFSVYGSGRERAAEIAPRLRKLLDDEFGARPE